MPIPQASECSSRPTMPASSSRPRSKNGFRTGTGKTWAQESQSRRLSGLRPPLADKIARKGPPGNPDLRQRDRHEHRRQQGAWRARRPRRKRFGRPPFARAQRRQRPCLGARFVAPEYAAEITEAWLKTPFSGDSRHQGRINKIAEIEKGSAKPWPRTRIRILFVT